MYSAKLVHEAGFACPVVSVGSTPIALSATSLFDVTEVRAGVYVFFDLVMTGTGVCANDDIALGVFTSVIGHQSNQGSVIVDAGWLAMSRDRCSAKQTIDHGFGMVCDIDGNPLNDYHLSGAVRNAGEAGTAKHHGYFVSGKSKRFATCERACLRGQPCAVATTQYLLRSMDWHAHTRMCCGAGTGVAVRVQD